MNTLTISPARSLVLDCTLSRQLRVSEAIYRETFVRLCDAIDGGDYFSGEVDFRTGGVDCRLSLAVIVCRQRASYPEGEVDEITDLVPIWWEFHTERDGEELPNDFQFTELKKYS